ncbi:MAG: hypothetical protein ACYC0H_22140, partial [Solirubrobacteraceae bacterium]
MATLVTPAQPLLLGGLLRPDPSLETYPVRPGGLTAVQLSGEDRVRIIDVHGGQVAEVTTLGAPLGVDGEAPATVLRGLAAGNGLDTVAGTLAARGLDLHEARCAR